MSAHKHLDTLIPELDVLDEKQPIFLSCKYWDNQWSMNKQMIFQKVFKKKVKAGEKKKKKRSGWAIAAWGWVCLCSNSYLGEKLLKVPHKDLSLLLDELLTAELQVTVNILLRVNIVFLYLRCSLGATETKGLALSSGISLKAECYQSI